MALHQRYEADDEPADLASARAEVEWRTAGLSRALLATPPDTLRTIAERARLAEVALGRWQARVGARPALDPVADEAVLAAVGEVQAARAQQNVALHERHRLLATGNGCGLLGLGVAAVQIFAFGSSPMALPVAVAVAASPIGPLVSGWLAAQRCSIAARRLLVARARWSSALDAAGVATMGDLAARRIAAAAWERRSAEAEAAVEAARPHQRAWYRLAGPGVPPTEVDAVLDRVEELRQAQLRLLGRLLAHVVEGRAMSVLAPVEEVASPTSPPSWLDEALDRIRKGGRLRLWGS
ncbi:MAG TPA: hypothetical protein VM933_09845 [Acidimicrobiales bacterium]|nr:hypothetical protein [Acidimicrobiales bacterium]